MSRDTNPAHKALETARKQSLVIGEGATAYKTPDAILKSDEINKAFAKEYNRFKLNQRKFSKLMASKDSYPMICELFDEIKKHLNSLTDQDIDNCNHAVNFSCFGRTWTIKFLFTGMSRINEIYLSIWDTDSVGEPTAILAFDIPNHWEF
jgi:hypothetical protein